MYEIFCMNALLFSQSNQIKLLTLHVSNAGVAEITAFLGGFSIWLMGILMKRCDR